MVRSASNRSSIRLSPPISSLSINPHRPPAGLLACEVYRWSIYCRWPCRDSVLSESWYGGCFRRLAESRGGSNLSRADSTRCPAQAAAGRFCRPARRLGRSAKQSPRSAPRRSGRPAQRPSQRSVSGLLPLDGRWRRRGGDRRLSPVSVPMVRIPKHAPPIHPGEMLLEEFLAPLGITQVELAKRIGVTFARVNEIVHGRRGITPDTALRLERFLGASAESWLNEQLRWDLYHVRHSAAGRRIARIRPMARASDCMPIR